MDKKVIFGELGGLQFTQESLDFMQQSTETLHTLARALCTLEGHQYLIVSGCETQGVNVSAGIVIINGELLPFAGGSAKAYVQIQETREEADFMDGQPKEVYVSRQVVFSTSGTQWATFRGLSEKLAKTATAGGDLTGNYPNPTVGDKKITEAKIADKAVVNRTVANDTITNDQMLWGDGDRSVVLGPGSSTAAPSATEGFIGIAIGEKAIVTNTPGIAIGGNSESNNSTVIGVNAKSTASGGIVVGGENTASSGIAIGGSSKNYSMYGVAVGNSATAGESGASNLMGVAIGYNARALKEQATALGSTTLASGVNSTALGGGAQATIANQIVLGNASISSLRCQVALTIVSDEKDKTDIVDANRELARNIILGLRPVEYKNNPRGRYPFVDKDGNSLPEYDEMGNLVNYDKVAHKKATKKGSRTNIGFIAQEVQKLLGSLTGGDAYGSMVLDNSFGRSDITEDGNQLGLSYEKLIPMLVSVVQDQQKQIDELSAKIQ